MMDRYTTRLLPFDEWYKLGVDQQRLPSDPGRAIVIVVEDPHGLIVGRWLAYETVILEGLFIEAGHRKLPGVAGALFHGMTRELVQRGVPTATTLIVEPEVESLAERHGLQRLPGNLWMLDLRPLLPDVVVGADSRGDDVRDDNVRDDIEGE